MSSQSSADDPNTSRLLLFTSTVRNRLTCEEIARALTDSLGASIPRDQVYDWLRLGIGEAGSERPRLVLILDSLFPADSMELMKQATQLLTNAGGNFSVLYALTDGDWDRVRNVPGRLTMSKLGRHAKAVILEELTDDEVELARERLADTLRIFFLNRRSLISHCGSRTRCDYSSVHGTLQRNCPKEW